MGVPSFFKWLARRYPKSVTDVHEPPADAQHQDDAAAASSIPPLPPPLPPQPIEGNPLIDNLYLDMNGIIHPCCHPPEGGIFTEDEMLDRIWVYVQRLVSLARPQRLVYMAIDGVAPRAKMNQQRSRRFRAAKEMKDKAEVGKKLKEEWKARGLKLPPHLEECHHDHPNGACCNANHMIKRSDGSVVHTCTDANHSAQWDSNVITPGTAFLDKVSASLTRHIEDALEHDPSWRHLTVLLSDAQVPGEGEHKIVNFIRVQRSKVKEMDGEESTSFCDPNTRHLLYGMDADLIMLGLATHERYFYIIRESLGDLTASAICDICGEKGHWADKCMGEKFLRKARTENGNDTGNGNSNGIQSSPGVDESSATHDLLIPKTHASVQAFQFIHLPILREYLERDLSLDSNMTSKLSFVWNFESALDDFILLCMFVGNGQIAGRAT